MQRQGEPLEIRTSRLNVLDIDAKTLMHGASPGDGDGQLITVGNREGGGIADVLQPVSARLRTTMLIFDDVDICWVHGEPMALLEEAADGILRRDPTEKPFDVLLFRAT